MAFTDYLLLDQKICSINSSLETNVVSYINPQNVDEEKEKFFAALEEGQIYNPYFTYTPRNPLYSYFAIAPAFETFKNDLREMIKTCQHDSLGLIFEKRMLDLFEKMELMRSAGTENFTNNSEEYYGKITKNLLSVARELVKTDIPKEKKAISLASAKKRISAEFARRGLKYEILSRPAAGSNFAISVAERRLFINEGEKFSSNEIKRLIAHEVEAHAYRYENGAIQPYKIFAQGLSKENTETEEGIAVKIEELQGLSAAAQLKDYAGRVIAVNAARKKDFYHTFMELRNQFSKEDAFRLALRAKRGTFRQDRKGAFTKDILYLRGKLALEKFLEDFRLEDLYMGRYSIYDYPLVRDVDGLKKPKHLPRFLKK